MSAQELTDAAVLLRRTHAAVNYDSPWGLADDVPGLVVSGDLRPWGAPTVARDLDEGVADWVVLMQPALAEPLAAWLDSEAARLESTAHPEWHETVAPHAFAIARAINGAAS